MESVGAAAAARASAVRKGTSQRRKRDGGLREERAQRRRGARKKGEKRSYGRLRNEAKKRTKESFKRLRTRGSRCERELPALGWRVCSIGVMGQLVSYRGSSVRGRKGTPCTLVYVGIEQRAYSKSERPRALRPFS